MKVASRMTRDIVWIEIADDLKQAHAIMRVEGIRHLPVLDEGKLVGMLSDRDVLAHTMRNPDGDIVAGITVGEVMTRELITCTADTSISTAAEIMLEEKIDSLPVTRFGNLIGMITSTDLLEILVNRADLESIITIPFDYRLRRLAFSSG